MADWTTVGVAAVTAMSALGAAWVGSLIQSRTGRYQADAEIRKDAVERRMAAYEQLLAVTDGFKSLLGEATETYRSILEEETERLDRLDSTFISHWKDLDRAKNRVYLVGSDEVVRATQEVNDAFVAFSELLTEAQTRTVEDPSSPFLHLGRAMAQKGDFSKFLEPIDRLLVAMRSDRQIRVLAEAESR